MKTINKYFACLFILLYLPSFGQMNQYNYKRELSGISNQWHTINLPNDIFAHVSSGLSDIRIYGVTPSNDTIEAPYILQLDTEQIVTQNIPFEIVNSSYDENGYYNTFKVNADEVINEIKLDFKQNNFDWRLKLEGSHHQKQWFTIIEDYRILSIDNEQTNFQFTKVSFPNSTYRYYRLLIISDEKPNLIKANVSRLEERSGKFNIFTPKKLYSKENKQNKQTEVYVDLHTAVSVSHIKINTNESFDFYRPITIQYLSDSVQTEKGWKKNYKILTRGTLNSMEENQFKFHKTVLQKMKIIIHNDDNQPLSIDSIEVKGYVHKLLARFSDSANYFLVYGNNRTKKPQYDISKFVDHIPDSLIALELKEEILIEKQEASTSSPLFKNKIWLWVIMLIIVLLLGGFSLKMMNKE